RKLGEVFAKNPGGATRVRIRRREKNRRVDDQPELRERAFFAKKQFSGIGGLLGQRRADCRHRVDRWEIAEKQDRLEVGRIATETAGDFLCELFDRNFLLASNIVNAEVLAFLDYSQQSRDEIVDKNKRSRLVAAPFDRHIDRALHL